MTSTDQRLREYLDRSEITNLTFRFTQAVDRRDFDTMARCCADSFRSRATGFGAVIVDVDRLEDFTAGLRAADAATTGGQSQHRYFCPAVELDGDAARIRLVGEVHNASGPASERAYRVSGVRSDYRATREAEGWRLRELDVEYQWRHEQDDSP